MRSIILPILVLLFIISCSRTKTPSITQENETDSLLELAYKHNALIHPDTSLRYALKALETAQSIDYRIGIAEACNLIALALYDAGDYDKSMDYILLGEKYADGDAQMTSEFMRIKARIYSYLGLHEKAKNEFLNGLSYILQIKEPERQKYLTALAYENLGHWHSMTNCPDSSLFYAQKNIAMLTTMDEAFVHTILVNTYTTVGEHHAEKQAYDSARIYFDKSIQLAQKYNFPYFSRTYTFQGDMYIRQNNADTTLHYYFKALNNLEVTGLKEEYPALYDKIANTFLILGDTTSAREYASRKLLVENELGDAKLKSAKRVLDVFAKKEQELKQSHRKLILWAISILPLLAGMVAVWLFSRNHRKSTYIRMKDQEVEVLKIKVNESFDEIIELAKKNDPSFMVRFQEVYPQFTPSLRAINLNLQLTELQLCALIYLQFTTKEIAGYTYRSVKTIQNRKNSLRKKLGIPSEIDITVWLNEILSSNAEL